MARINSLTGTGVSAPHWVVRMLEIGPGFLTYATFILPVVFAIYQPFVIAYFITGFDLYWFLKSSRMSFSLVGGYRRFRQAMRIDWTSRLERLGAGEIAQEELELIIDGEAKKTNLFSWLTKSGRKIRRNINDMREEAQNLSAFLARGVERVPSDIYHVVIVASYNESLETMRPSLKALVDSEYDHDRLIIVLAYEERGGEVDEVRIKKLTEEYSGSFKHFYTIQHPDNIVGELKGKGANLTFAGRQLMPKLEGIKVDTDNVIVTTLDADHRVDKRYFASLTYAFLTSIEPKHTSFQPIPMFFNNIWDAPAPMRIIATSNSFWVIINSMRPQFLRNFASHSQPLEALIDTDFWSVTTPVEDGHQYWRTYFRYQGRHEVQPLFIPIYQDATLSEKYFATFKSQFLQLQRWAYGVSDIPYVALRSWRNKDIPIGRRWIQFWRLFEGHYSWATAPLILTFVAWLPLVLNPTFKNTVLAHQLPVIASQIMTLSMLGLSITIWLSLITLPPRPRRYGWYKNVLMVAQWALAPIVSLCFGALAAINAQTHLMFGKYLGFRVTDKAVKLDSEERS